MIYSKKISSGEEKCGFILILKNKRSMFPESGKRFYLVYHGDRLPVVVDEIPCECMGLKKPHEHYHLHIPVELRRGDVVEIKKEKEDYTLEIERRTG
jgi:hypothetical protein